MLKADLLVRYDGKLYKEPTLVDIDNWDCVPQNSWPKESADRSCGLFVIHAAFAKASCRAMMITANGWAEKAQIQPLHDALGYG